MSGLQEQTVEQVDHLVREKSDSEEAVNISEKEEVGGGAYKGNSGQPAEILSEIGGEEIKDPTLTTPEEKREEIPVKLDDDARSPSPLSETVDEKQADELPIQEIPAKVDDDEISPSPLRQTVDEKQTHELPIEEIHEDKNVEESSALAKEDTQGEKVEEGSTPVEAKETEDAIKKEDAPQERPGSPERVEGAVFPFVHGSGDKHEGIPKSVDTDNEPPKVEVGDSADETTSKDGDLTVDSTREPTPNVEEEQAKKLDETPPDTQEAGVPAPSTSVAEPEEGGELGQPRSIFGVVLKPVSKNVKYLEESQLKEAPVETSAAHPEVLQEAPPQAAVEEIPSGTSADENAASREICGGEQSKAIEQGDMVDESPTTDEPEEEETPKQSSRVLESGEDAPAEGSIGVDEGTSPTVVSAEEVGAPKEISGQEDCEAVDESPIPEEAKEAEDVIEKEKTPHQSSGVLESEGAGVVSAVGLPEKSVDPAPGETGGGNEQTKATEQGELVEDAPTHDKAKESDDAIKKLEATNRSSGILERAGDSFVGVGGQAELAGEKNCAEIPEVQEKINPILDDKDEVSTRSQEESIGKAVETPGEAPVAKAEDATREETPAAQKESEAEEVAPEQESKAIAEDSTFTGSTMESQPILSVYAGKEQVAEKSIVNETPPWTPRDPGNSVATTPRGTPLIQRVEQLEQKLAQLEGRPSPLSSEIASAGPSSPGSSFDRPVKLSARHILGETGSKGTLLDRVAALEQKLAHVTVNAPPSPGNDHLSPPIPTLTTGQPTTKAQSGTAEEPATKAHSGPAEELTTKAQSGTAEEPATKTQSGPAEEPTTKAQSGTAEEPTTEASGPAAEPTTEGSGPAAEPITKAQSGPGKEPTTEAQSGPAEEPTTEAQSGPVEGPTTEDQSGPAKEPITKAQSGPVEEPTTEDQAGLAKEPVTEAQSGPVKEPTTEAQSEPAEEEAPSTTAKEWESPQEEKVAEKSLKLNSEEASKATEDTAKLSIEDKAPQDPSNTGRMDEAAVDSTKEKKRKSKVAVGKITGLFKGCFIHNSSNKPRSEEQAAV